MNRKNLIPIQTLCTHYQVETAFFKALDAQGLIELTIMEATSCIHEDQIQEVEKMIRLHQDLQLNIEGIDAVRHLLERIESLQAELQVVKSRLGLYESL